MTGPNARSQSVLLIIFSAHRGVSVSSQEMSSFTSHSGPGVGVGGGVVQILVGDGVLGTLLGEGGDGEGTPPLPLPYLPSDDPEERQMPPPLPLPLPPTEERDEWQGGSGSRRRQNS